MSKDKHTKNDIDEHSSKSNMLSGSKTRNSFVQNPDQNNQIHKEALGPNAKR